MWRHGDRTMGRMGLQFALAAGCWLLAAVLGIQSPAFSDWAGDERMIASVALPQKVMSLDETCAELGKQTSSEFYVDRRHGDVEIAWYTGETKLKAAMAVIESMTGLQWRMVGDMFFLSEDASGAAVKRWQERYADARQAHLAGIAREQVKEWVYYAMPFPPKVDRPWELTLLQREQLAYQQSLLLFTMTPPQLYWLETALANQGYPMAEGLTAIDQLAAVSPEIPIRFSAAMVIYSSAGDFLVEMPLSTTESPTEEEPSTPVPAEMEPGLPDPTIPTKKTSLKGELRALWVTDADSERLPDLLKQAKADGFNALFLPAFGRGHAIYPSKLFPQDAKYKGSDLLKKATDTAADLGMKVHAVIEATLWGDADRPVPTAANYPLLYARNLLGRTYVEQEKWQRAELASMRPRAASEASGEPVPGEKYVYLCPASSQLPRLLRSVAEEIAANYKVAGVCLDGVDYPKSTPFFLAGESLAPPFGYTLEVRREMIRLNRVDPVDVDPVEVRTEGDADAWSLWEKFRRERLMGLVSEVCRAFKSKRPDGIFSATLDLASDAQSPVRWSKAEGLDAILPSMEIRQAAEDGAFSYSREESRAVGSLHRAVLKNAAVIPAVGGLDADALADQVTALADVAGFAADTGLKGLVLRGDTEALSRALEALGAGTEPPAEQPVP